jgi:hypothetical protein
VIFALCGRPACAEEGTSLTLGTAVKTVGEAPTHLPEQRQGEERTSLLFGPAVKAVGESTTHIPGLGDLPSVLRLVLADGEREGVDYIDFVLIASKVDIDIAGEMLKVSPFYIATTELSVGAARSTQQELYSVPAADYYAEYLRQVPASFFERIRQDDAMPYLPDSYDRLALVMFGLSLQIGLPVRLPSSSEWLAAADVEDEHVELLAQQAESKPKEFWGTHLQPVGSGMANQYGLRHVWGNVTESVRPTFDEAVLISRATLSSLGPLPPGAVGREQWNNGVSVTPDSFLYFGGSVEDSHEDMLRCTNLDRGYLPVPIVPFYRYTAGVRPVLDLSIATRNALDPK